MSNDSLQLLDTNTNIGIRLPWLDAAVEAHGRFWATAAPWIGAGFNCIPVVPGAKSAAISGWGRPKKPGRGGLHDNPRSFAEPDSPRITQELYAEWAHQFKNCNAAILYGSGDITCVDVDDASRLDAVLRACGDTPLRVYSGRVGGGVHLLYRSACKSRNAICRGVDIKSRGAYALAPGSIHAATGREYTASRALVDALARSPGVL